MADIIYVDQIIDDNGDTVAGALCHTYALGTTTPETTYQEAALTTPHANPVVADAGGRLPQIFHDGPIKVRLATAADVTVETLDPAPFYSADAVNLFSAMPTTTGTSSAYVASTGLGLTTIQAGTIFPVRFHVASAADATLSVDSIGAKEVHQYRRDATLVVVRAASIQAGATLFLRYNGTEYTILGGQGYLPEEEKIHAVKLSNETRTTDTSTPVDSDLDTIVSHSGQYLVEAQIIHNAGAGAIKFRIADPTSGTTSYQVNNGATVYAGTANYVDADTSATDRITTMRGLVTVTDSTGVGVYWGQNSSNAADTIVKAGSYIHLTWLGGT